MNYKRMILILFILLMVSITAVSAADFNDTNVMESSHADDSLEIQDSVISSASTGTFDDLQVEINNAPVGSVLNLTRDYTGHYGSRIDFSKDLTIDGQGHTLDCLGEGGCSAFYSSSGNITLKNLRIINGHNDYTNYGGAIYITGSAQYTLENCIFENNYAKESGGAIYNDVNKTLTIKNCTFKSSSVDKYDAGAIYSRGLMIIKNSVFDSNSAKDSRAGALDASSGAIIEDSIFKNNFAYWMGGAIDSYRDLNLKRCVFENNKADGMKVQDSYGGAVNCYGILTIDNCTFKDNYAYDYGGAISAHYIYINYDQSDNQTFNTFFINNEAGDDEGGAIRCWNDIYVKNTLFSSNKANVDGGAIYSNEGATVTHCLFESNKADGAKSYQCYGGAIYAKGNVNVDNCTFKDNYAEDYAGAIYGNNIYINHNQNDPQPFNTFFINNKAGDDKGGALFAEENVDARNTQFSDNSAKVDGGAIYTKNAYVYYCLFENNQANGAKSASCYGGAIRAENYALINNCTFKNNYAENKGGAIYASSLKLSNSPIFEGNEARDYGGAIYTDILDENVEYVSFINNKAKEEDGGAVYINSKMKVTFSKCIFVKNSCGDEGGAIYLDSLDSQLSLTNNIFISNSAGDEGQTVFNKGVYDKVTNNFWGGKNPSSNNDELIEYKVWTSNIHHSDSDPLKMDFKFENTKYPVNTKFYGEVLFYKSNGALFTGELYGLKYLKMTADPEIESMNYSYNENSVLGEFIPDEEAKYTITADLCGYRISKVIDVYAPENDTENKTIGFGGDVDINTPGEKPHNNNSDNDVAPVIKIPINNNPVNNFVSELFFDDSLFAISNIVDGVTLDVNGTNQSTNNSVVKSVDTPKTSSGDSNLWWILLLIVVIVAAGGLIWKYKK